MKITKYHWMSDEIDGDGTRILIHTLYGTIHTLSSCEVNQILRLKSGDVNIDNKFIDELIKYQFWVEEKKEQQSFVDLANMTLERQEQNQEIKEIVFIISYGCNFNCPYCYEKEFKTDKNKQLSKEQVDKALKLFGNSVKYISFFGGEPFLPSHKEIIQYIVSKTQDKNYTAMTNGYYLEEYLDIIPEEQISFVQVTLDGDKNIHDKTRVLHNSGETFDKIMNGIDKAIKMGIHIKIRMNISEDNITSCISLRKKMLTKYSNSLLSFELYPLFQNNYRTNDKLSDYIINDDFQLLSNHKLNNINETTDSGLPIEKKILNGRAFHQIVSHCEAHSTKRFLDPYGDIYSCILSVGWKNAKIGTYFPNYKLDKDSIIYRNILKINECYECKFALICGGGCPLVFLREGGDVLQPNCSAMYDLLTNRLIRDCKMIMKWRGNDAVL